MRELTLLGRALLLGLVCLGSLLCTEARAEDIRWYVSLEYAKRIAKQRGCPVLICFEARSDVADESPTLTFGPKTTRMIQSFVAVRLQLKGDGTSLAQKYRLPRTGQALVLDADEKLIARASGFQNPGSMLFELRRALRSYRERAAVKNALAKNPQDVSALLATAIARTLAVQPSKALPLINRAAKIQPGLKDPRFAEAYYTVGDHYQSERSYDTAINHFQKAKKCAKTPSDKAYALISIGSCYLQSDRPKLARPFFEAILKVKNVSEEDAGAARRLINGTGRGVNIIPR